MRRTAFAPIFGLAVLLAGFGVAQGAERLFPAGLAEREWATFSAEGFSSSVTGVIYRDGNMRPGMPLGGIGTGFITLGTDGTLDYCSTIFNAFMERWDVADRVSKSEDIGTNMMTRRHIPTFPLPFLGMAVDGKTTLLSLRAIQGVQAAKDIAYWGHYPVADLQFDTDSPVSVGLRAWTPFLPGDPGASNTPGAVFELHVRNASDKPQKVTLALSFSGPREVELGPSGQPWWSGAPPVERQPVQGEFRGVTVRMKRGKLEYGYALGVAGGEQVRLGGSLGSDPNAWNSISSALPEPGPAQAGSSAAVDLALDPGTSRTVRFVLAWYAPFWLSETDPLHKYRPSESTYAHMYHARFSSALEVAQLLAQEHASLLKRILSWQQVIYAERRVPGWLQDALINVLAVITQNSFWVRDTDPNQWWGDEGIFSMNESLASCPQQSCIANDWIGQWPLDLFFPELTRSNLRARKHYQEDTGEVPFNFGPRVQLDSPGSGHELPWGGFQIPMNSQYYVHQVDRQWQRTGDDNFLRDYYPSVKAAVNFIKTKDSDGDGLVETTGLFSQYHDGWNLAGAASHVAGYWFATLEIAERMAKAMGDDAFARERRASIERGKRSLEETLWNEEVGSYLFYNDTTTGKKSDTVLSDQLIGEWFAHVHGLSDVFPPERVKRVLSTLERLNVAATTRGIWACVRPDMTPDKALGGIIVPSYSTVVPAMLMIYSGDPHFRELGLEIVRRTWHTMVIDQDMAWDMPCMLNADGTTAYGLEYHHNTMLWTMPMAVLGQDIKATGARGGFIYRIIQAARGSGQVRAIEN